MRCRAANFFISTCAARTPISSSSSRAKSGTCLNSWGSHAMVHLYCNLLILTSSCRAARDHNRPFVIAEDDFLVTCGENDEGGRGTFWLPVIYPWGMRFFSVLFAGGVLASL